MKKVEYLCYYDTPDNITDNRRYILSAANVVGCISEFLSQNKELEVEIVSIAGSNNPKGCRGGIRDLNNGVKLKSFPSIGKGGRIRNKIDFIMLQLYTFFYLMHRLRKGDTLLVYHSIYYIKLVTILKKLKKCNLLLQVEEIYADVMNNQELRNREISFFSLADSYIFPTILLNNIVNQANKPFSIIHGTYKVENDRANNVFKRRYNEEFPGVVHCVYAGTLDPRKGGAAAAAAAAAFLPSNYYMHILGFGNREEVAYIESLIHEVSLCASARVTYDGVLSGEDYIQFIQACDIGLSTQNPEEDFNSTSFPSKILSYLSNGLRVVTINIPAIKSSAVSDLLFFYDKQIPEEIAKSIACIDLTRSYDSRERVRSLGAAFQKELMELFIDE